MKQNTISPSTFSQLLRELRVQQREVSHSEFAKGVLHELDHLEKHKPLGVHGKQRQLCAAKMALAHLKQVPDYYSRLAVMETEARAFHLGVQ